MASQKPMAGWRAFRALRQPPAPIPIRRHGNYKHGSYAKTDRADRQTIRWCLGVLRGRVGPVPPAFSEPVRPLGWAAYRRARELTP